MPDASDNTNNWAHQQNGQHVVVVAAVAQDEVDMEIDDQLVVQTQQDGDTIRLSSGDEEDEDEDEDEDECNKMEEFIMVKLSDIRKEVQCPICLGIIRKTRTVMECLHRFCRECIDKSMRLGNNECPACRTHCASRRSLRDDPNYDALIAAIYPDIDQYEEEEMAYQEDEKARNMKFQASIAQTLRRQTEALSKKRKRSNTTYRRRRNYRSENEEEANAHDPSKDSSSADERSIEVRHKRSKRWRGQPSPAGGSGDGGSSEQGQEVHKEAMNSPLGLVGSSEMLAWGKGGIRSNTRHGSGAGGNAKHSRNRFAKLSDHLRNLKEDESELEIQVELISLDQQNQSALQRSYLCNTPTISVGQLCEYIASQTSLPPERVEILASKGPAISSSCAFEACKDNLQVLDSAETLVGLRATTNFFQGHLLLAYRQKASM